MLALERFDDVTRLEMSSRRSRLVGFSVSAYLVRGVIIDCGFHTVRRELAAFLRQRRPRGAMVTHQHEDHAGNVELIARSGVPLAIAPSTVAVVSRPQRIGFYRRFTWEPMPPLVSSFEPFEPDDFQLIPTPGHSADHHAIWDPQERTLFAGDLFLGVQVRIAHPGEDPSEVARSARLAAALGPRRMFDGHRGPIADPVGALTAKADWIDALIARIERRIASGAPDDVILREELGGESWPGYFSAGDYSRGNFVRAVRKSRGLGPRR